ncbi:MAG: sigma-54 dependent transcriptional regulator [Gemmatimonadota bacterium]|jgi:DNA-binding NtrC family response regulator
MRILVVDDEASVRFSLRELLEAEGHEVVEAEHAPAALEALADDPPDLVLCDLRMPAMDGLELLEEARRRHPDLPFVLMTAHGDERTAVRALKGGAWDYLPKPFDNEEIRAVARRTAEMLALRRENARLRDELADRMGAMIGRSEAMADVFATIRRAGPTDATVLIEGESGTGKELAARALHDESPRARGPFVALNCSALPSELVESELFGHGKGAFTGADRARMGLFEAADGGTLLLDEVGDLSPPAQAKLLRALETRTITRIGETSDRAVDVRVLAATNRPLDRMVREGTFREDLYYRLAVVTLTLPPLRERREDLMPLVVHFLSDLAERHGKRVTRLADDARRALLLHDWPGNVRELRNALERAVVLTDGDSVGAADLPSRVTGSRAVPSPVEAAIADLPFHEARDRATEAFERSYLEAALERHGGNISATARSLDLHRQSLQRILRRLDIDASDHAPDGPDGTTA